MPNWGKVLERIQSHQRKHNKAATEGVDYVRRLYLKDLHKLTGRNIIAYYSGFFSKPHIAQTDITDEDKNGFMMAVHGLDRSKGLDLIIHTPGGSLSATHSIINYLHSMFGSDIRAVIPQIAMSAGTIMACACKSILMGLHSNLGPIDPHINNVSTYAVLDEFKKAYEQIKNDPSMMNVWRPILEQYRPTFLSQCEYARDWTKNLVTNELTDNMFNGDPDAATSAADVVEKLSNHTDGHSKHIHMKECIDIGLKIEQLEEKGSEKLQDLVLTVHHCYMNTIMNTSAYKLIENQNGAAFVKHQGTLIKQ